MCLLPWLPFLLLPIPLLRQSSFDLAIDRSSDFIPFQNHSSDTTFNASYQNHRMMDKEDGVHPFLLTIPLLVTNFFFAQPTRTPCVYCSVLFFGLVYSLCSLRAYQCSYALHQTQFHSEPLLSTSDDIPPSFGQFWIQSLIGGSSDASLMLEGCGCFGRRADYWMDYLGWFWCNWLY